MNEIWRSVVGWEGLYEVSDLGRVRSTPRDVGSRWPAYRRPAGGVILSGHRNTSGYLQVKLCRNGRAVTRLVHRLVLEAFVGRCPDGMEGCHGPSGIEDNSLANLRWDTRHENALDITRHGNNFNVNKTHCVHGHEFTEANTYLYHGKRGCKACRWQRSTAHRLRKQQLEKERAL